MESNFESLRKEVISLHREIVEVKGIWHEHITWAETKNIELQEVRKRLDVLDRKTADSAAISAYLQKWQGRLKWIIGIGVPIFTLILSYMLTIRV